MTSKWFSPSGGPILQVGNTSQPQLLSSQKITATKIVVPKATCRKNIF